MRWLIEVEASEDFPAAAVAALRTAAANLPPRPGDKLLRRLAEAAGTATAEKAVIVLDRVSEREFRTWIQASRNGRDGEVLLDIGAPLTFQSARMFAAALVAAVERAENEPDPAEAAALAGITREALHAVWERGETAGGVPERVAAAILARYTLTERQS